MDIVAEQRIAIKYCVCCGKTVIETLSELKEAYEDECLTKSTVLKWHAIFVKDLSTVTTCVKPTGWPQVTGEARAMHWASRRYFKKACSEKIDIETDVSDSE